MMMMMMMMMMMIEIEIKISNKIQFMAAFSLGPTVRGFSNVTLD